MRHPLTLSRAKLHLARAHLPKARTCDNEVIHRHDLALEAE